MESRPRPHPGGRGAERVGFMVGEIAKMSKEVNRVHEATKKVSFTPEAASGH